MDGKLKGRLGRMVRVSRVGWLEDRLNWKERRSKLSLGLIGRMSRVGWLSLGLIARMSRVGWLSLGLIERLSRVG